MRQRTGTWICPATKRRPTAYDQTCSPAASPASSAGSALARSGNFLRTQYWIWPLVAAVILVFVGVFVRLQMEGAMKTQIAGNLKAILNANTEALRAWAATMKSRAEAVAEDSRVCRPRGRARAAGQSSRAPPRRRCWPPPSLPSSGRSCSRTWSTTASPATWCSTQTSSWSPPRARKLIGMRSPPGYAEQLRPCLEGQTLSRRRSPAWRCSG